MVVQNLLTFLTFLTLLSLLLKIKVKMGIMGQGELCEERVF